jgi:outer membrane protein assembly factor BamB
LWSSEAETLSLIVTAGDSQTAMDIVEQLGGRVTSDLWLIDAVAATLPSSQLKALAATPGIVSVVNNKLVQTSQEPVDWNGWASGQRIEKGGPTFNNEASTPAVALPDGGFAVVGENGVVLIANAEGTERAQVTLGNGTYDMTPLVGSDGTIYIANSSNQVYALNPDGSLRWQELVPGSQRITGVTLGPNDVAYAVDKAARLHAVSVTDHQLLWSFTPPSKGKNAMSPGDALSAPVVSADGTVYYSTLGANPDNYGHVIALNSSGQVQWVFEAAQTAPFYASPVLGPNGIVFVASPGKNIMTAGAANVVYALDSRGQQIYEFISPDLIPAPPAVGSDGSLYVAAGSTLYGLDPGGSQRFAFNQADRTFNISPVLAPDGGTVYLASTEGVLYAINSSDGTSVWEFILGDNIVAPPVVEPTGHVIVAGLNGTVAFLNPVGLVDRQLSLGHIFANSPTVGALGQTAVYKHPLRSSNGTITASGQFLVFNRMPSQWNGSPDVQETGIKAVWKLVNPVAVDVGADILHQKYGLTGGGVGVAVLDSGVFFDAEVKQDLGNDLQQRFVGQVDFVGAGLCSQTSSPGDQGPLRARLACGRHCLERGQRLRHQRGDGAGPRGQDIECTGAGRQRLWHLRRCHRRHPVRSGQQKHPQHSGAQHEPERLRNHPLLPGPNEPGRGSGLGQRHHRGGGRR